MLAAAGKYRKSIAAAIAAVLTWGGLVIDSASQPITAPEWLALAVALAGVAGVYGVTND